MTGRMVKRLLAVLLCLAVLGGSFAFADAEIPAAEAAEDPGILDPAALQQIVDDYCRSKGLDPEKGARNSAYQQGTREMLDLLEARGHKKPFWRL